MSETYRVQAKRWAHGWELHIDDVGVTQSRTLEDAEQMVRDYIESLTGRDVDAATIEIHPVINGQLEVEAVAAVAATRAAEADQLAAAKRLRAAAKALRGGGLSLSDTATILNMSRARVSQLTKAG